MFIYEYVSNKENAQNEEDNKCIGLNRDDFQRLVDRINRIERTLNVLHLVYDSGDKTIVDFCSDYEKRVSRLEETVYDRLDERIDNLRDQNRALVNAINTYTSKPVDVFKLQEQLQHSDGSTVNPNKFNPGLCDT